MNMQLPLFVRVEMFYFNAFDFSFSMSLLGVNFPFGQRKIVTPRHTPRNIFEFPHSTDITVT